MIGQETWDLGFILMVMVTCLGYVAALVGAPTAATIIGVVALCIWLGLFLFGP